MASSKKILIQSQTIESRRGIFLLLITSIVFIIFTIAVVKKGELNLEIYACFAALILFTIFPLYLGKITRWEINNSGFFKKGIFKNHDYLWDDISSVELDWHFHLHGVQLFMKFTFKNSNHFPLPLAFYGRKNMRILCEAVLSACPDANISDKIRNMAEGKFPWYIF